MTVPERFRVRLWGTRGTCPSPGARTVRYGGNTSCVEVRAADGTLLILDAGSGIRSLGTTLLQDADTGPLHVVLSHGHGDHVLGLPHFAPLLLGRSICLHSGNADAASLRPLLEMLLSPPIFPALEGILDRISACDWTERDGEHRTEIGTTTVCRFPAQHPGDAAVLRLDDAHGPAIAYAPDNELSYRDTSARTSAWRAGLVRALRGVRVLLHDATYTDDELAKHSGWGHSSAEEATRFAMEAGVDTLVLFHHHPDRSDDAVDAMLDKCREIAAGTIAVTAGFEGQIITL